MKLAELATKPCVVPINHPDMGDIGITATIRNPSGRDYHSRYSAALADDANKQVAVGALMAEAAVISIDGIDDLDYQEGNDLFRQDEYFWMTLAIADFITKKKAPNKKR